VTIRQLAEMACKVVGFSGRLVFDSSKPDGTPRKFIDSSKLHALGWNRARALEQGVAETYAQAVATGVF
jgi:GDP-L-fucose synthase